MSLNATARIDAPPPENYLRLGAKNKYLSVVDYFFGVNFPDHEHLNRDCKYESKRIFQAISDNGMAHGHDSRV